MRPFFLDLFVDPLLVELLLRGLVGGVPRVLVVPGRPVVVMSSTGQTPPLIGSGGSPTFREIGISG